MYKSKLKKNAYMARWIKNNPKRWKEIYTENNRKYYKKNKKKVLAYAKKWANKNKDKIRANSLRYYYRKRKVKKDLTRK